MRLGRVVGIILVVVLITGGYLFNLYGDWLWFNSVGYSQVFSTIVLGSLSLAFLTAVGFLAFSSLNIILTRKRSATKKRGKAAKPKDGFLFWIAGLLALMVGSGFSDWRVWLRFLNPTSFGVTDPVFGMDVGFYVFTMPFLGYLLTFFTVTLLATTFLVFLSYVINSGGPKRARDTSEMEFSGEGFELPAYSIDFTAIKNKFVPHLSVLMGFLMIILSAGSVMAQWGLLYSGTGAVFGAAFTDLSVNIYVYLLVSIISAVLALLFFANARINRPRLIMEGVAIIVAISVIGFVIAGITQAFIVAPNEFNVEEPYIQRNIDFTLQAFDLSEANDQMFPVSQNLTLADLQANPGTMGNIRLWDWRPLTTTYNQVQLFRTYYNFHDVDIDRYDVNGSVREVMVSAREMDTTGLPGNAQTWVNQHLVYTHGYGVVMNPVEKVTPEGLPEFYIKNIPPESEFPSLDITRPEIYFGEDTTNYIITGTTTQEFDYPSGDQNIYSSYQGDTGIPVADLLTRLTYAVKFGSTELLFSSSIGPDSKISLYRDIGTRLSKIAPFLRFDSDPYVVVSGGKLYWINDAYVVSDMYPYSQPIVTRFGDINYMRNPVKAVVDAYTGDVSLYVIDDDPIIQTYEKIFPGMFKDISEMPSGLRDHIRFPEDLFSIQNAIYAIYHMKDPQVFYTKEDVWVVPDEVYMGNTQTIQPYYVILQLPGEHQEEFLLMIPFVPRNKDNLIAWMAARSDQGHYGEKVVYQFSKQQLVYGPMQVEARIDQNTDISQSFTLWGQSGSSVLRGNTLVIPIKDSILYIEPVYLEATAGGTLPELKRVIVAYGSNLTMQETLQESLDVIFGQVQVPPSGGNQTGGESSQLIQQIAGLYVQAQQALQDGNLGLYQQYINQIGDLVG